MTNHNIRAKKPLLQIIHLYKAHKAFLHWLTLKKSLNMLYFCQLFIYQFGSKTNTSTTAQPTTTHKQFPKLYFAHHTGKQLLSESNGSPPGICNAFTTFALIFKINKMKKKLVQHLTVLFFATYSLSCKKSTQYNPLNVSLIKMQTDSVKTFINGKWKVVKTEGGVYPTTTYPDNYFFEFSNNCTHIRASKKGLEFVNDTLIWVKDFIGGDSINVMSFHELNQIPDAIIPLDITNDTLILSDDGTDATYYHLIKN